MRSFVLAVLSGFPLLYCGITHTAETVRTPRSLSMPHRRLAVRWYMIQPKK